MIDHGSRRESADESPLAALAITARTVGVHRLSDGALAAGMVSLAGPPGGALHSEESLRHVASLMQQTAALDALAISCARSTSAHAAAAAPVLTTVDPTSLSSVEGADLDLAIAIDPGDVVRSPRSTIEAIRRARGIGRRVVVRVGVDDLALAMLPVIGPDIVVVRDEVLAQMHDPVVARFVHELAAHLQNSSATVVAEGVHSDGLVRDALSLGAQYGIGAAFVDVHAWGSGPVAAFPTPQTDQGRVDVGATPFTIVSSTRRPRRGGEMLLEEMGRSLESQATGTGASAVVVRTAGTAYELGHLTGRRWDGVSADTGLSPVYGVRVPLISRTAADGAARGSAEPVGEEWNVAVLGPHVCAVLSARCISPGDDSRFEFVQTYDRSTVVAAVRAMLSGFDPD
ncbi:hypothetical protein [Williamsia deligens]|uniref:EAL domain-containing protein n=1 Tax=Williamsia deligens TaxID=321325 RepID=A0ABW3G6D7_9NOCA|nr:hypothetical protein [Williamsia deligens]MCP2194636.1 EAL domain, c-di-GMP-specific phosphodiesterase class I (or its enzymatically inactive variant) [Williamsia deligens]